VFQYVIAAMSTIILVIKTAVLLKFYGSNPILSDVQCLWNKPMEVNTNGVARPNKTGTTGYTVAIFI